MRARFSLHTKFLIIALGILLLFFLGAYYFFYTGVEASYLDSRIELKGVYLGRIVELVLERHLTFGNPDTFKQELRRLMTDDEVASLKVVTQGQTIYLVRSQDAMSPLNYYERRYDLRDSNKTPIGVLTVGFWQKSPLQESTRIQVLNAVIVVDLLVLVGLVLHLLTKEIVTRPLWQFIDATQRVATGRFDSPIALDGTSKEEQDLAHSFNEMVGKLSTYQRELEDSNLRLEERVVERTGQLERSKAFSEAVIATVQEGIYAVDSDKIITTFNDGAVKITGIPAAAAVGRPCYEVMAHPFCRTRCILERLHQGATSPESQEEYLEDRTPGDRSWIITGGLFQHKPGALPEGFPGGVETIKDLSHTRRLQLKLRQYDKLSSLGTLAAGVAHELNNPLSNIRLYAQIMDEELRNLSPPEITGAEPATASIRNIIEQADRAGSIVRKMLEFAGGGEQLATELLFIDELVGQALEMVRYTVESSRVTVRLSLPDELPPVRGHRISLQQVLINLFTNSRQAMGPEGGEMSIEARHDPELDRIVISVADTGPGIPPEHIDSLFDPFFTTKDVGEGTGLGLSISYGIIKEHGGEITVTSDPGRGATFTLVLPVAGEDADMNS